MSENRVYEITHYDGPVLFSLECESLRICIEAAVKAGANLVGARLRGANLVGADLRGANLVGADLRGANLVGANLVGANLVGANLVGANLEGANLEGANLVGANLVGAYLAGAYFAGADLRGANLRGANLVGAYLRGANLVGAYLRDTDLIDAGQDRRGFRFWAWRNKDGGAVYRAGCHEWTDFAAALAWYGEGYSSTGDRHECLARLALLRDEAARRWQA